MKSTPRFFKLLLLLLLVSGLPYLAAQEFQTAQDDLGILDIQMEEFVETNLVEFKILVTDKKGNPIRDLKIDEVEIFEGKQRQKIAFLEPVSSGSTTPNAIESMPSPTKLYGGEQNVEPIEEIPVLPPKPVRRIVIAFDVKNSKLNSRERWKESALEWVETQMQPTDQVAVVLFRSYPEWIVPFTTDKDDIGRALDSLSIKAGLGDRDRNREISRLVDDMRTNCTDPGRPSAQRTERFNRASSGFDEQSCAFNFAEAYAAEWHLQANESIANLRSLTGQLAALPGRKAVLLFSEGLIVDSSSIAVGAMVSVYGSDKIDMTRLIWQIDKNSVDEINALHHVARAAEVAFYTFDTRNGTDGGFGGQLEQAQISANFDFGINPWNDMFYETRQSLQALAKETGGQSFHGRKKLPEQLTAAADSFFGLYSVGFYREETKRDLDKIKVKISRRKTEVVYPDRIALSRHQANPVQLHLSLGMPQMTPTGREQEIPLTLSMEVDALPLRRGAGGRGCQLGALIQAVRPDGSVAKERLDLITVVMTPEQLKEASGKRYDHITQITVPQGPYRIRVRISDDRQKILGDRAVDVTVGSETIRAGLHPEEEESPQ